MWVDLGIALALPLQLKSIFFESVLYLFSKMLRLARTLAFPENLKMGGRLSSAAGSMRKVFCSSPIVSPMMA